MAEKLNSMPGYQARMPRQPHNVGQRFTITHSTGMELPVYFDMLHTGDELYFSPNLSSRFNPLLKPFLGDVDIHLDYFFVPLSVIYTPSTSLFYQTDDLLSSTFNKSSMVKNRFPCYDIDANVNNIRVDLAGPQHKYGVGVDVSFNVEAFDCLGKSLVRLFDLLQYNPHTLFEDLPNANPHTTPWFLCAYHACHELYYRNDDREIKDYHYNIDQYYDENSAFSDGNDLLHINYVSSYKDYFNSIKVSPIGSSVSMLNGSSSWDMLSKVESYLFDSSLQVLGRANVAGRVTSSVDDDKQVSIGSYYNVGDIGLYNGLNAANIRQLFMVDKLLRVTGRANKDYESQFLAHFGIKVPHDVIHDITHIGHDMVSLGTSPVVSQSDTFDGTSGSALGEIGGQGYGRLQGKQRKFVAPFHGVFMIICYAVPKFRYYGGISKLHDLSDPMKFWQPEYDRKGMQPLFSWESDFQTMNITSTTRLGWQFGYEQFKRKYDRVSLGLRNWNQSTSVNEYAPWVLSREAFRLPFESVNITDHAYDNTTMLANFTALLSTPHDLDTVMAVRYNTHWIADLTWDRAHELFVTDPLITDFNFQVKKVNFMSEYGEPELD